MAVDGEGSVYVADFNSDRIRKISADGVVSTLAGDGTKGFRDGPGAAARFNRPFGVAVDCKGSIYVADNGNHRIRKISADGVVSTLAGDGTQGFRDGPGAAAWFNHPGGLAVDGEGSVYVADCLSNFIRKISADGLVSTLAGDGTSGFRDGPGAAARFNHPCGVAVDGEGSVYVADNGNDSIRKISPDGVVSTLAGDGTNGFRDGPGPAARFNGPHFIALFPQGGALLVADDQNHRVRKIADPGIGPPALLIAPPTFTRRVEACQRRVDDAATALERARTMSSMPSPKEEELKNWTDDKVIEFARSIISAKHLDVDALKAAKLDGESLLEMRQNQSLVDAVCLTNGLEPTVVYKLAGAVRKLVPPVQGMF